MKNRSPEYTKGLDKNLYLKFAVDRCISWVLLMLASPLIMFIAYCIWVEGLFFKNARGPIFYREIRISQGKFFTLYKFRVLTASALLKAATEDSVWFLQFEGENTTLMGKILIQCYLDEMPQLLNIFLGRMSFVGPRPRVPPIYEEDVTEGHRALKYLKGGITGPAQLAKGLVENGGLELSEEYLEQCNSYGPLRLLKYDLGIMWKSVFKLMKAEGLQPKTSGRHYGRTPWIDLGTGEGFSLRFPANWLVISSKKDLTGNQDLGIPKGNKEYTLGGDAIV